MSKVDFANDNGNFIFEIRNGVPWLWIEEYVGVKSCAAMPITKPEATQLRDALSRWIEGGRWVKPEDEMPPVDEGVMVKTNALCTSHESYCGNGSWRTCDGGLEYMDHVYEWFQPDEVSG